MSEDFQQRELRGITPNFIKWLVGCTITIVLTLTGSYYGIQAHFKELEKAIEIQSMSDRASSLEIESLKGRLDRIELDIRTNMTEIEKLKIKVE